MRRPQRWVVRSLLVITLAGFLGGVGARLLGLPAVADALWIVAAAVSVYLIAYRYYALFIARVIGIDTDEGMMALARRRLGQPLRHAPPL